MCSPPRKPEQEVLVLEKAQEGLGERSVGEICSLTGAVPEAGGESLIVEFLGAPCRVQLPGWKRGEAGGAEEFSPSGRKASDASVTLVESGEELDLKEKILLLYYLKASKGTEPSGRFIAFRELKGSGFYFPIFLKRTGYLLKRFSGKENLLPEVAPRLGGTAVSLGDCAAQFPIFPRVPLSVVLWKGDAEFPPKQSILFDETISDFLPAECIVVATEILLKKLTALLSFFEKKREE